MKEIITKPTVKNLAMFSGRIINRDGSFKERENFIHIEGKYYRLEHVKSQPATDLNKISHKSFTKT